MPVNTSRLTGESTAKPKQKNAGLFCVHMDTGVKIGTSSTRTYTLVVEEIDTGLGDVFQCEVLGRTDAVRAFNYLVDIHRAMGESAYAKAIAYARK